MSSILPYLVYILETILLYQIGVSYWGLRLIPIYGDYYFYKSVLPKRKTLSLVYALINLFTCILAIVCVCLIAYAFSYKNEASPFETLFYLSLVLFFGCFIAERVIALIFKLEMAEKFAFPKLLGIVFWIIPLVGDICLLVNASKYDKQGTMDTIVPTTNPTNIETPMFEPFEENMKHDVEKEQPIYNVYNEPEDLETNARINYEEFSDF